MVNKVLMVFPENKEEREKKVPVVNRDCPVKMVPWDRWDSKDLPESRENVVHAETMEIQVRKFESLVFWKIRLRDKLHEINIQRMSKGK